MPRDEHPLIIPIMVIIIVMIMSYVTHRFPIYNSDTYKQQNEHTIEVN